MTIKKILALADFCKTQVADASEDQRAGVGGRGGEGEAWKLTDMVVE